MLHVVCNVVYDMLRLTPVNQLIYVIFFPLCAAVLRVGFQEPFFAASEDAGTSAGACLSYSFENDPPSNLQGLVNMMVQSMTFPGGAESKSWLLSSVRCFFSYGIIMYGE